MAIKIKTRIENHQLWIFDFDWSVKQIGGIDFI